MKVNCWRGGEALKRAGMRPLELSSKEGLALVSGTTSPTAMAALAIYDLLNAAKAADIIGSAHWRHAKA